MCRKFSFFVSLILVLCLFGNAWGLVWGQRDIGNPGIPGSASEAAGTWTISGSGADIDDVSDQFYYVYRPIVGDATLEVNLASMGATHPEAKAGPMIRESFDAGSRHAAMVMTFSTGLNYIWRLNTDDVSNTMVKGAEYPPNLLRITRTIDVIKGEFCQTLPWDPLSCTWKTVWTETVPMNVEVTIGMVVCSQDNAQLNTSTFDNLILTAAPYEKAWDLKPEDGTVKVSLTPTLSWLTGDSATTHDVYLGTDPTALSLVATKTAGDESYTPAAPLEGGTVYYWKIVEQPGLASDVMSFKTERTDTGTVARDIWEGIGGGAVTDLTSNPAYPHSPTWSDEITVMDTPDLGIDSYGGRMVGFLSPETSGNYTFWIAADDGCELWLSTTEKFCDSVKIAYWTGWTGYHDYDAHAEQQSAAIPLVGGQKYVITALWKEGGGGDHCSVAWEGPDAPSRTEIDGYYLMPDYVDYWASNPTPPDGATLTAELATSASWTPGLTATSHNVYLGTDPAALPLLGNVAMPDTTIALPTLALGTYYLRIDADDGTDIYEGCVTSFTVVEWLNMDIGDSTGGSATQDGDCWNIIANGGDIWGGTDHAHFIYKTPVFTRDEGTIIARVMSVQNTNGWAKAGVAIRQSTAGNSRNAAMLTTPNTGENRASFQSRPTEGANSGSTHHNGVFNPEWVKLVRKGNVFQGYHSDDGIEWHQHADRIVEMNSFIYVGLIATSHTFDALSASQICDVTITTPDPRQAWGLDPDNEETMVDIHAVLRWNAGVGATEHHVYFSADEEAVVNRTVEPVILPVETTELAVGPLDLTKMYYWCVDEVVNPIIPGEVFSFQAENYRTIDDFEAYEIDQEALPVQTYLPAQIVIPADPPPENEVVEEAYTISAEELPEQIVIDPGVEVEPGYWIPGYTIPGYTIPAIAPPDCLLGEWLFEGNYDDTSGSGFHGTPIGDANIVVDATRGNVLSIGGDIDFVDCNNPAALNFSTGNWALSAWTRTTMSGTSDVDKGAIIANGQDATPGHRYCLIICEQQSGRVNLVIDDNAGDGIGSSYNKRQFTADTVINDNEWHHTLGVRDGAKLLIYTDGVPDGSMNIEADYDLSGTSQDNVRIGAIGKASDDSIYKTFDGLIDDARIYDCNLTENHARSLAGVGDLVIDPIEVPPVWVPPVIEGAIYEPMLVHYEFEDSAFDTSGNQRHGTVVAKGSWPKYGDSQAGLGRAIEFNDDGDHVVDDDCEDYMNGLDALTIACWIKSEKTDRDEGWVHFGTQWSDRRSFRYDKDGGSSNRLQHVIKYGIATTGGNRENESSDYVQTKNWQHVAMTWQSGSSIKLYVDGVLDDKLGWEAGAVTGTLQDYSQMLVGKGSKDDGGGESWNGFVDDFRIYNTVLSYGQIRTLAGELDDLEYPPKYGPLIAGYDFEGGDATDSSGNNLHGTLLNGASVVDGELILDGDNDCVDLGRDNRFNLGPLGSNGKAQGPFSLSLWFKMNGWGNNWGNVLAGKRGEGGKGWQLRRRSSSHHLCFTTRGPGDDDSEGSIEPTLGEWHHVAAIYDGTQKWVYLDNELDRHQGGINNLDMSGHNTFIGARANRDNNNSEQRFDGDIDDVKFYNLTLNAAEIRYLAGLDNVWSADAWIPLLAHYEFDEGDARDSTQNELHGELRGNAMVVDDALIGSKVLDLDANATVGTHMNCGNSDVFDLLDDDMTISTWIRIRDFGGWWTKILSNGNTSSWRFERFEDTGAVSIPFDGTNPNGRRIGDIPIDDGGWHHIAAVLNSPEGYSALYVDGIVDDYGSAGGRCNTNDNEIRIGDHQEWHDRTNGWFDDVRIYSAALRLGQIRTLAHYSPPGRIKNTWSGRAAAAPSLDYNSGHESEQCMRVEYTGSGAVSRLEPWDDGKHPHGWNGDFSLGQAQALSLWFKGDPENAPGTLFAQLTTVVPSGHTQRVLYDGAPEDLLIPEWQEWNISLHDLSTGKPADPIGEMGLPITKIKDVGIGVIGAGSGVMYIDDVRLQPVRCVPKYGPAHDLTDDCGVGRDDLGVIANAWLTEEGGNGLWYEYYEGNWNLLPYFPGMAIVTQGQVDNFDIGVRLQEEYFGFRFTGIVTAPVGGDYTFYTESDDGSKLYIDGTQVVDNDGPHGMQWREGTINLAAGEHVIEVRMFQGAGGLGLNVDVAGPGIPRMRIPDDVLSLAPGIPADLNGDGIVNFLDYADVLNHFGDEALFPPDLL